MSPDVGLGLDRSFFFPPVAMAPQYEMAVGLKKGHKVTKLQQKPRPSRRRGVRWGNAKESCMGLVTFAASCV